ncbi:MAG: hypothetical protein ABIJ12_00835 [bacterium]
MTNIYIADANILFDLFDIDLFEAFLRLDLNVHISQFVMDETEEPGQRERVENNDGILVQYFDSNDLEQIQLIDQNNRGLSFEDCSILLMRQKQEAVILTGDGLLRRTAEKNGYEVHGIIWVLDRLIEKGLLTCSIARDELIKLMAINKRLPKTLCDNRLEAWKKNDSQ